MLITESTGFIFSKSDFSVKGKALKKIKTLFPWLEVEMGFKKALYNKSSTKCYVSEIHQWWNYDYFRSLLSGNLFTTLTVAQKFH